MPSKKSVKKGKKMKEKKTLPKTTEKQLSQEELEILRNKLKRKYH